MKLPWRPAQYTSLSSTFGSSKSSIDSGYEENGELLCGYSQAGTPRFRNQDRSASRKVLIVSSLCNFILFSFSCVLYFSSHQQPRGRNPLLKATSFYSPILEKLTIPTFTQIINGTLFPRLNPSIARQLPNPAADSIWDEYELLRTIPLTGDEVRKLGKDPEMVIKLEDDIWGLGDDAYMGSLDIFHQLHCLNSLRKLIFPTYYNYSANTSRHPRLWTTHLTHCADILMQNIMCTGNTDIVPMQWMETQHIPFPDFSINHQCRDFESLVEWRKENSLDLKKYVALKKPEGVKEAKMDEMYFVLFDEEGNDRVELGEGAVGEHVH